MTIEDKLKQSYLRVTGKYKLLRLGSLIKLLILAGYFAYLSYAIYYHVENDLDLCFCDGLGLIIILTGLSVLWVTIKFSIEHFSAEFKSSFTDGIERINQKLFSSKAVRLIMYALTFAGILTFLIVDGLDDPQRLVSISGLVFLILIGIVCSKHPRHINWRIMTWGLGMQFVFALVCLRWDFGRSVVDCMGQKTEEFLAYSEQGSVFAYDYLVSRKPFLLGRLYNENLTEQSITYQVAAEINEKQAIPGIPVFSALSVIYFFCFFVNIMFYYGYIQAATKHLGWLIEKTMGTTTCESTNAAANIFLGQTLAPLVIQPYLKVLTMSEVHAVVTSGFATIAGNVFALYISLGINASFLIAASVMSAPAAIAYAKLLYPETEESKTTSKDIKEAEQEDTGERQDSNVIDAATRGASEAAEMIKDIVAILVAVVSAMAFLNGMVSFFGNLIGHPEVTFEWILGKIFIPLAWMMGVEWADCEEVGRLLGKKLILNEYIAYGDLGQLDREGAISKRSVAIATYAMCGYANPASMGITLAVLTGLCPERRSDFSKVLFRAFCAGTAACFLTACFAGALYQEGDSIIPNDSTCNGRLLSSSFFANNTW